MTELWKPIPGYEGIYEASDLGRIRSAPGKTTSNAKYSRRVWKCRIIKPRHQKARKRQDLRVALWKDGAVKYHLVSRIIALTWLGEPAAGMTVNHINGIWEDNSAANLEWVTLAENIKKGFANGQYSSICCPVTLIAEDGTTISFRSQQTASEFLGRKKSYVNNVLKRSGFAKSKDGAEYILRREAIA